LRENPNFIKASDDTDMRNDSKVWQIQEDGNVPNVVFQPVLEGIGALYRPEVLETVEVSHFRCRPFVVV
jgi:hypothetical protein